jgi:glycosyltransferase involved in cell wall biosynthesis
MKIAVVTATFPPDIGGMGNVAYEEAKGLWEKGNDVNVFTLSFPASNYEDTKFPFKVIRKKTFLMGGNAGMVPSFKKELKDFELVHLHFPFYGGAEWVMASGVPYVVTYHMDAKPTKAYQQLVKFFYDKFLSIRILQKAKKVILVDNNHEFKWESELFPDQLKFIPNAIDTKTFCPRNKNTELLRFLELENKKIFLFVGNLMPIKGISILLNALKEIPDINLLVIGGGYNEDHYRNEAKRLGIENKVKWLGPCYDKAKLAEFYNLSEAVVVPSFSESFSLVAAEAMACGKPVIASNIPGVKGRVVDGETGLLFEKGSTNSLVKAIKKFDDLNESEKNKMGQNARLLVESNYNMEKHIGDLLSVYQKIL